jgi:hypothetical protein
MNVSRARNADRLASKGFLAGTAALMIVAATGCGSSSPAAVVATPAAATTSAAAGVQALPSAAALTSVKATGGGDFCKAVAASINKQATAAGGTDKEIAAGIATARAEELQAAQLAPAAIKADVTTLFAATDAVWAALAKANYDYSKLQPSDMVALSSPEVAAAEKRLTAYMTTTCGITAPGAAPTS